MKKSFLAATETLPKKIKYYEKQWVNEEIKNYSKEKSEYHLKMQTLKQSGQFVPQDLIIAYNALKKQTKQACRAAINNWWKQKAEEAEKTTQLSMKQGRRGSVLKMLKIARLSKTKASTN